MDNFPSQPQHQHYGKAMMQANAAEQTISIRMECNTCGEIRIGPFHVAHIGTVAHLLQQAANQLGIPPGRIEEVENTTSTDPGLFDKGDEQYRAMPLEDALKPAKADTPAIPGSWAKGRRSG